MQVVIDRKEFLDALGSVLSVVPSTTPMTVLQSALLDCRDPDAISLTATNLDTSVSIALANVVIQEGGRCLIPAPLRQAFSFSGDDKLMIATQGPGICVSGNRSNHFMPTQTVAEFPEVSGFQGDSWYKVPAWYLKRAIEQTSIICPDKAARASDGITLVFTGTDVKFVTYDHARMSVYETACTAEGSPVLVNPPSVPARAMKTLASLLDGGEGIVDISVVDGRAIAFRIGGVVVWSRLLFGEIANTYFKALAQKWKYEAKTKVGLLLAAVKEANVMTTTESGAILLRLSRDGVTAETKTVIGESKVGFDALWDEEEFTVSLRNAYLIRPLSAMDPDSEVTVSVIDDKKPVRLKCGPFSYFLAPQDKKQQEAN